MRHLRRLPPSIVGKLDHITALRGCLHYENGNLARVDCNGCGMPILTLQAVHSASARVRKVAGEVLREVPVALMPNAAYTEAVFEVEEEDGRLSSHHTPICRSCRSMLTIEKANDIFLSDLEQLAMDADARSNTEEQESRLKAFFRAQHGRKVKRVL